ncbi:MAG: hypothetical protein Q9227_004351 [Pyrenula ochraceoflavens]
MSKPLGAKFALILIVLSFALHLSRVRATQGTYLVPRCLDNDDTDLEGINEVVFDDEKSPDQTVVIPEGATRSGSDHDANNNEDENDDDGDDDDDDDDCPADSDEADSPPTNRTLPATNQIKPPSGIDPLPQSHSGTCLNSTTRMRRTLSKRNPSQIIVTTAANKFSIMFGGWIDTIYVQASDGLFYPYDPRTYGGTRWKLFQDGTDAQCYEFAGKDDGGGSMYFIFDLRAAGRPGDGWLVRNTQTVPRQKGLRRPKLIERLLGGGRSIGQTIWGPRLRWGKIPGNGFTYPEGTVPLWHDDTDDGKSRRSDSNGVALCKSWNEKVHRKVARSMRTPVFYTDQGNSAAMREFINERLNGVGFTYFDVFQNGRQESLYPDFRRLSQSRGDKAFFMGVYRGSRAIAQETRSEDVYVVLQRWVNDFQHRTIFDQVEIAADPRSIGVGQVWRWVELPTLMRNPFVKRIWAIQRNRYGQWTMDKQWDSHTSQWTPDHFPLLELDDMTEVPRIPGSKH